MSWCLMGGSLLNTSTRLTLMSWSLSGHDNPAKLHRILRSDYPCRVAPGSRETVDLRSRLTMHQGIDPTTPKTTQ